MPPKLDTSLRPTQKVTSARTDFNVKLQPISIEDLMTALKAFKVEILSSSQALSDLQATQYQDLRADLSLVSSQMLELKAENLSLRNEVDALKRKVASLEHWFSVDQSQSVVSQVLQKTFERDKCLSNLIIYGVPESSSQYYRSEFLMINSPLGIHSHPLEMLYLIV